MVTPTIIILATMMNNIDVDPKKIKEPKQEGWISCVTIAKYDDNKRLLGFIDRCKSKHSTVSK